MNSKQFNRKEMFGRLGNYFDRNATAFDTYAPLKLEIAGFFSLYTLLEVKEELQAKDLSMMTAEKQRLWKEWVAGLVNVCESALGWALRHNPDLVEALSVTEVALLNISYEESADRGREIVNILQTYITSLAAYGLTPDLLGALDERIETFKALLPDLNDAIKLRSDATQDIIRTFGKISQTLVVIGRLIAGKYGLSAPELVQQYRTARKLDKTPCHHTGLRLEILHEGTQLPYEGAVAVIRELQRTAYTDMFGKAEILQFRPGSYHVDIIVDGEVKKTLVLTFARGKVIRLAEQI